MNWTKAISMNRLLTVFLFLLSLSGWSQNADSPVIDSALSAIEAAEGKEKAWQVAEFTRNANFHELDHRKFKSHLENAYAWEEENPDLRLLNTIRLGHVNMLVAERNNLETVRTLQEIIHSGEDLPVEDSLSVYNFLYGAYISAHAYSEALEILRIRDRVLDNTSENNPFIENFKQIRSRDRGLIYLKLGEVEKAVPAFKQHIERSRETNDLHHLAGGYNNLGLAYLRLQMPDSAIACFQQSGVYWTEYIDDKKVYSPFDRKFLDLLDGNTGSAYNQLGRFEEAIPLIRTGIRMSESEGSTSGLINGLNSLSRSYLGLGNTDRAMAILDSAAALLSKDPTVGGTRRNLEMKIKVHETTGQLALAYPLYKRLVAFNDSVAEVENRERLAVMEVVYEVDQKNREIEQQKLRTLTLEADNEKQRSRLLAMLVAISFLSVVSFFLVVLVIQRRRRNRFLAEKNHQIEHQKEIIEQSLVEKETLLKEIHHRVKNNLQLISGILQLQGAKFDDAKVQAVMEEGQGRIKSMALIHEQLYQNADLGKVNFHDYIGELARGIATAFTGPDQEIALKVDVEELNYDINLAVPLGLIVNELVTNSYKHAFKGKAKGQIEIKIKALNGTTCLLEISDDGKGFPEGFDPAQSTSLGLRLVKGLSRQLDGQFRVENGLGTHFFIQFENHPS